jgi:cellulose synthase/poly-beta-1,6-N-acetylglucosamine synthase-like glycosyltransferase
MEWLLFGLAAMLGLAALHPFTTYPLSLLLIRRWRRAPDAPARTGSPPENFAICFCAYNEERVIEAKMRNLLELRRRLPNLEILAYVDAASDRTAELLHRYAKVIKLHVSPERRGKTHGMNLLVGMAQAPIVVFTDANVMLAPDALANLGRYFADPAVGCVCGHLVYVNPGESVTAATGSLYWRLEERIKQLETETGSAMGADGSLFAVRRALHRPVPEHIIDDMYLSFSILCDGYRVVRAPDVRASEESVVSGTEEFRRKIRIACQAFNVHRLLWPRLRRLDLLTVYKYVSHKWLRWLSIYFLALSALCFEAGLVAAGLWPIAAALLVVGAAVLYAGRSWQLKPLSQIWDIVVAFCGAGIGVWYSLRGERFQTWTPANSIRR